MAVSSSSGAEWADVGENATVMVWNDANDSAFRKLWDEAQGLAPTGRHN
jgi:hypothetical protein